MPDYIFKNQCNNYLSAGSVYFCIALLFGIFLSDYTGYIEWMGIIFLRALNMNIIPLVFSSIVSGVMNLGNARNIVRLGLKTMGYYLSTSIIAIFQIPDKRLDQNEPEKRILKFL